MGLGTLVMASAAASPYDPLPLSDPPSLLSTVSGPAPSPIGAGPGGRNSPVSGLSAAAGAVSSSALTLAVQLQQQQQQQQQLQASNRKNTLVQQALDRARVLVSQRSYSALCGLLCCTDLLADFSQEHQDKPAAAPLAAAGVYEAVDAASVSGGKRGSVMGGHATAGGPAAAAGAYGVFEGNDFGDQPFPSFDSSVPGVPASGRVSPARFGQPLPAQAAQPRPPSRAPSLSSIQQQQEGAPQPADVASRPPPRLSVIAPGTPQNASAAAVSHSPSPLGVGSAFAASPPQRQNSATKLVSGGDSAVAAKVAAPAVVENPYGPLAGDDMADGHVVLPAKVKDDPPLAGVPASSPHAAEKNAAPAAASSAALPARDPALPRDGSNQYIALESGSMVESAAAVLPAATAPAASDAAPVTAAKPEPKAEAGEHAKKAESKPSASGGEVKVSAAASRGYDEVLDSGSASAVLAAGIAATAASSQKESQARRPSYSDSTYNKIVDEDLTSVSGGGSGSGGGAGASVTIPGLGTPVTSRQNSTDSSSGLSSPTGAGAGSAAAAGASSAGPLDVDIEQRACFKGACGRGGADKLLKNAALGTYLFRSCGDADEFVGGKPNPNLFVLCYYSAAEKPGGPLVFKNVKVFR